jgi:hypothetical protein
VAGAWLSFARTGNPGAGLKPWTAAKPNTMVFDTVSECRPLREDQLVMLMGNIGCRGSGWFREEAPIHLDEFFQGLRRGIHLGTSALKSLYSEPKLALSAGSS